MTWVKAVTLAASIDPTVGRQMIPLLDKGGAHLSRLATSGSCLFILVSLVACLQKVYELVVRHFLACVSQPATGFTTTVLIDIAGETFTAHGLMITAVRQT